MITKQPTIYNLNQYKLISVQGEDSEKFLQGQLTCDVSQLTINANTICAHCDAQGKVNAIFRLIAIEKNDFVIMVHTELAEHCLTQLKKYAIFSKVSFTESDLYLYGATFAETLVATDTENRVIISSISGDNQSRALLLTSAELANHHIVDGKQWDILDIRAGIPLLSVEQITKHIPQALNLQLLEQAISFKKGCYIGQETIARAKYRGANKRALFTFTTQANRLFNLESKVEMQLGENWRKTGTIISVTQDDNLYWIQIILNKDFSTQTYLRINNDGGETSLLELYDFPYQERIGE